MGCSGSWGAICRFRFGIATPRNLPGRCAGYWNPTESNASTPRVSLAIFGATRLPGWAIKPFAIIHSDFREVLYLDSDSVPVRDPQYLFRDPTYLATGSLFWTDRFRGLSSAYSTVHPTAWSAMNVPHRDEPECESGQIMVDKAVVWRELNLCLYFNQHADSYYRFLYGDKDTFRFAWHRLGRNFNTVSFGPSSPPNFRVLYQLDPYGSVIFQHRARAKWIVRGNNRSIAGFQHEATCLGFLDALDQVWDQILEEWQRGGSEAMRSLRQSLAGDSEHLCFLGHRLAGTATFLADGSLHSGIKYLPSHWQIVEQPDGTLCLALMGDRAAPILLEAREGGWCGERVAGQRESICIIPRRMAPRSIQPGLKGGKQALRRDISAQRPADKTAVRYECELLTSGGPPPNDLILRFDGDSLASGDQPMLPSLEVASELPPSANWSGESRSGSASAIQLEMFEESKTLSATETTHITSSAGLVDEPPAKDAGGIQLTHLAAAFDESAWSSGAAVSPLGETISSYGETISSYGETISSPVKRSRPTVQRSRRRVP